jgi:DNA-directed RNA polymerase subunit N
LWETFKKKTQEGEDAGKVLDELGLERYCCRALFLGHVDLIEQISKFKKS